MHKLGLLALCLVVLSFIFIQGAKAMGPNNTLPSVDVATLATRLASDKPPFLLDVREPSEFESGHINGAKLIPLGTVPDHLGELPKDTPIVVICRSGNRSAKATAYLLEHGFTHVENMSGGMNAWAAKCASDKKVC